MDDVIYRQAAIDALTTECSWTIYDEHGQLTPNGEEILGTLKKIPFVDAVEVVRCEDCRFHEDEQPGMVYCPAVVGGWVEDDWFCKGGERKDDGKNL